MNFRISGLFPAEFQHLFNLSENELKTMAIKRYVVDKHPGFPDRIELKDAEIGETVLLLNHVCQPAITPYHASHAIFVREGATRRYNTIDQVPDMLRLRLLSLRAYDGNDMMIDADVVEGTGVEQAIARLFTDGDVSYIHVHNAKQGCYVARVDRA
jgi:hypothetical protein